MWNVIVSFAELDAVINRLQRMRISKGRRDTSPLVLDSVRESFPGEAFTGPSITVGRWPVV